MKKALLMAALMACFASCKKDKKPYIPTVNGTWELRSVSGGFGPTVAIPDGKRIKYQFTTNSRYVKTDTNKVETRGNFSITVMGEERGYKYGTITFTNPDYRDAIRFKPDTIYIGSSAADGPTYQYIKIK
jgi:hypothetical protein